MPPLQDDFSDSLVASPESQTPRFDVSDGFTATDQDGDNHNEFTIHRQEGKRTNAQQLRTNRAKAHERNDLHPYVQALSLSNLDSCVALEDAVFPAEERCLREKVDAPESDYTINPAVPRHPLHLCFFPFNNLHPSCVNASSPTTRSVLVPATSSASP